MQIYLFLSIRISIEAAGFGGALKNIGMGCGSRAGKWNNIALVKPSVDIEKCKKCHLCAKNCAHGAISFDENGKAHIDHNKCVGCGRCLGACNFDAIYNNNSHANELLNKKMAEYSKAVLAGRPNFHINLVLDISPYCDCHAENDVPILPDIGMFASFDPVALDQACADACNAQKPIPGSRLDDNMHSKDFEDYHDHFKNTTPQSEWKSCLEHAEKIGIGTRQYEIIKVN